jgi:hypothetical protein
MIVNYDPKNIYSTAQRHAPIPHLKSEHDSSGKIKIAKKSG